MNRESDIPENSRAILIGVSRYHNDLAYPSYPAVANSLHGMYEILIDPDLCGWPKSRVELISNPTHSGQLITKIRQLARLTSGVLLFYFAGHGVLAENNELCLAIADTDPENPDATGIEYSKIRSMFRSGTSAATTIAILDSCYSGRAIGLGATHDHLADKTAVEGAYILTAADDTAHVAPLAQQVGVCTSFTGELLSLVRAGIPGGPPELTFHALYPRLRRRLETKNLPRPNQRGTDTATNFIFTRNAAVTEATTPAAILGGVTTEASAAEVDTLATEASAAEVDTLATEASAAEVDTLTAEASATEFDTPRTPGVPPLSAEITPRESPTSKLRSWWINMWSGSDPAERPAHWRRRADLKKGARITGTPREKLASDLKKRYEKGASIRELAEQTGRSYGFVHRVLVESGVQLRGRGGATRGSR